MQNTKLENGRIRIRLIAITAAAVLAQAIKGRRSSPALRAAENGSCDWTRQEPQQATAADGP